MVLVEVLGENCRCVLTRVYSEIHWHWAVIWFTIIISCQPYILISSHRFTGKVSWFQKWTTNIVIIFLFYHTTHKFGHSSARTETNIPRHITLLLFSNIRSFLRELSWWRTYHIDYRSKQTFLFFFSSRRSAESLQSQAVGGGGQRGEVWSQPSLLPPSSSPRPRPLYFLSPGEMRKSL